MPISPYDRYGSDVLSADPHPRRTAAPRVPATAGLVVEDVETGFTGAVVRVETSGGMSVVVLQDRHQRERAFRLGAGFWVEGKPVHLTAPPRQAPQAPTRTASGSRAVPGARARVARGSRIWVEGRHDAELIEKVWGEDLRLEGVVVEMLDGVDHLPERVRDFSPGPGRRLGVLVDHLVPGSKESVIAARAEAAGGEHVLVLGHPYVDVWQAVKPARLGLDCWPHVPRGTDIKVGTLQALGWPARTQADIAQGWKRILGRVRTYMDLEPALLGRVEELVDFVTVPH